MFTDSSSLPPPCSWPRLRSSSVFQPDPEKRKHSSGSTHQPAPVPVHLWPWCSCLPVHTAAKASSTFLPHSPHFTGDRALHAEEGPQLHRLPEPARSLLTKNGETRFLLRSPKKVCLGGTALGGRLWIASRIKLCFLNSVTPQRKGVRPELFIELCGGSFVIKLLGCFLSSEYLSIKF